MAAAVRAWSPVIIFTWMPAAWQASMASMASARGGSIMPCRPRKTRPVSTCSWVISSVSGRQLLAGEGEHPEALGGHLHGQPLDPLGVHGDCREPSPPSSNEQRASTFSTAPLT